MNRVTDWSEWSREAVELMRRRNLAWQTRFELTSEPFHWDLASATLRFERATDVVAAALCVVGTTSISEGTFLWAWANEGIPSVATAGLERVREFGVANELMLLTTPEVRGTRSDALEILATAGRILDAEGVFSAPSGDVTCYFVLQSFRVEPSSLNSRDDG